MSPSIEISLTHTETCPLCGANKSSEHDCCPDSLLAEINRYLPPAVERFALGHINKRRKCDACGLVYLSPRPTNESLALIYARWYGHAYRRVMTDPTHIAERLIEFERYHLRILEASQPQRGRLLDVGCGSGLFLSLAKRRGWSVSGIELDPATAMWAREQAGIDDVRAGRLEDALRTDEKFDAITMFDYLEHTDRPGADLDRLIAHLAPGGLLMIRLPNAGGWQARIMRKNWIAIMPTHLSYFSSDVLREALMHRGLQICSLSAKNYRTEIDIIRQKVAWVRMRLWPSASRSNAILDVAPNPTIGNPLPALWRWLWSVAMEQVDHVGGWFGAGNNLTAIARKRH